MIIENWLIWLCVAAIFAISTILSRRLFLASFAIGAVFASVTALLGFGAILQWGLLIVISGNLVLLFVWIETRTGMKRYYRGEEPEFQGPVTEYQDEKPEFRSSRSEYRGPEPEYGGGESDY